MSIATSENSAIIPELDIEDLYPLSPLQNGLLFHTLNEPESQHYLAQFSYVVEHDLKLPAFSEAWQAVFARHSALRSSFAWEDAVEPIQIVHRKVSFRVAEYDLRDLELMEQQESIERFLTEDRKRGFSLDVPPLARVAVLRLGQTRYQIVFTHHHLLLDGWSYVLLLKEVTAHYMACCSGQTLRLPPARLYRDYIHWLQQQDAQACEAFWRDALAGLTEATPLTCVDETRSGGERYHRLELRAYMSVELTARMRNMAAEQGLTLASIVHGAWALLLSLYTGKTDVLFGVTVAGRPPLLAGTETMVGLFINMLPLHVELDHATKVADWLRKLQASQIAAQEFGYTSLADIQSWSSIPRSAPLFETILSFQNYPMNAFEEAHGNINAASSGASFKVEGIRAIENSHYPVNLVVAPENELELKLVVDLCRLSEENARLLLKRMHFFLEALTENAQGRLGDLPLATKAEQSAILEAWNATRVPQHPPVQDVFVAQAKLTPEACALAFGDRTISYGELDALSNQLARYLKGLGVTAEIPVGVCFERGTDVIVALLAVLKAGGFYVPLDPSTPLSRLDFMVRDAGMQIVMATRATGSVLPSGWYLTVFLDEIWGEVTDLDPAPLPHPVEAANSAYAMYTSGSTGEPKGTIASHRSVTRLVCGTNYIDIHPHDTVLHYAPLAFDASTFEIWAPLLNGARLAIAPLGQLSIEELAGVIQYMGVTILWLTSGLFVQMADQCLDRLRGLRKLLAGGDVLPVIQAEKTAECLPGRLSNMYGPTENTTFTSFYCVPAGSCGQQLPIGAPITDTQTYVLDAEGRLLPPGAPGELYIGGAGVARGYLRQPAMTAEKFVPDHITADAGARLYRTGDRARWRSNGILEFLGRIDTQVKIRGFRVELGEIEAVLSRHNDVIHAAAYIKEGHDGSKTIMAAVVPASTTLKPEDLRAYLLGELPGYAVPAGIVFTEALPLTQNGKVDRKALSLLADAGSAGHSNDAPRTPVEEIIAGIWSEVLNLGRVGREEYFFDLGGHSLLATQVISRLRVAFGVEVPLRALFEKSTVAALAEEIDRMRDVAKAVANVPLKRHESQGTAPLSFAQQRLWFLDQLHPESAGYNCPADAQLSGLLDLAVLARCLNEIVRRHEVLRTRIMTVSGSPAQIVDAAEERTLTMIDISVLEGDLKSKAAKRLMREEALRPFDLARHPIRAFLLRLDPQEHVLVQTLHHIATDGWSFNVLVREFRSLYEALSKHEPSPLPEPAIQYSDFAIWQREWLQGEVLQRQLDYWVRQLSGLKELDLPTDYLRPRIPSSSGAMEAFRLDESTTEKLKALSRREGVTVFMMLLAGLQLCLGAYAGQNDVAIGTDLANRNRSEIEGLVGFFVNQLVLRADVGGNRPFSELLANVREMVLAAYANQDAPFEKVVEALGPERSVSDSPLFRVKFVLQNVPQSVPTPCQLQMRVQEMEYPVSKFDLTLTLDEPEKALGGTIVYRSELFRAGTIRLLKAQLEYVYGEIAGNVDVPLSQLRLGLEALRSQFRAAEANQIRESMGRHLAAAKKQPVSGLKLMSTTQPVPPFRIGQRKQLRVSKESLVNISTFSPDQSLPAVIQAAIEGVSLSSWLGSHRNQVQELILQHGAVLLRGFGVHRPEEFQSAVTALCVEAMSYKERSSPRSQVSDKVYTSTDYPADEEIFPHNEHSYSKTFPVKIFFCCDTPAITGGATPLADTRRVYKRIPAEIRAEFERKGWMFVRNFNTGLGLPWQTVFQTEDNSVVEEYCRSANIEWEWRSGDQLRTRQVRPTVVQHPITGEHIWFNHLTFFHVSTLKPSLVKMLRASFAEDEMPNNTFFGDGSPIPDDVAEHLRRAYLDERVSFSWEKGDLVVLDNVLTAHARNSYTGLRKILFAMAEPFERDLARELSELGH